VQLLNPATFIIRIPINATEGIAIVVNHIICSVFVLGLIFYVHACHPRGALPAPGLAGCPVGRGE